MMLSAALLLIVICEVALGQDHSQDVVLPPYSLDMALNSVDDQYDGCTKKMTQKVEKYLEKEISANISGFGTAWKNSEKNFIGPKDNLQKNHLISISVYTSRQVYKQFNEDVITGKRQYKTLTFRWYSLYFWLTEAIQVLKKTQQGCRLTYRGTDVKFNVKVQEIRFGLFASSSLDQNVAKRFGKVSCFEIYTCHAADVSKYSDHPHEKEVLIPLYEKFKIKKKDLNDSWCETVYMLNSSGIRSDLNCKVAALDSLKYHRMHSLSRHYIREGQIMTRRPILSDPHNSFVMKSEHGDKKGGRLIMLRVKQGIDSKINHQYQMKDKTSDFKGK